MTWYRTLGPVTYTDGSQVRNITKAGVRIDLSPAQAAELFGMVVLDRSTPFEYPRADFLKYESAVLFPEEGIEDAVYLANDSGLLYRWIEGDYAPVGVAANWDDLAGVPSWVTEISGSGAAGRALLEAVTSSEARGTLGAQVCATIADLRGIASVAAALGATSGHVRVLGYYAAGDGGGGMFRWDSADTTTADNGGTVIAPTSGPAGRWKRIYEGAVNTRWFGVHPSRSDNTGAFQAAVDWVSEQLTGGVVFTPAGYYRFTFDAGTSGLDTITIAADHVFICGEGKSTQFTIRDHTAVSDEVEYFFTFSQATRGNGGGVSKVCFDGNSQLTWCIKLDTWRDADFMNFSARDVHGGLLDAHAEAGTEILGENIRVRGLDYSMSSGVNACVTQYGVRFRPSLSASWADSFVEDSIFVGVWDTGVELDGAHRFSVQNCHSSWNYSSTNSIDGLAKAGCRRGVRITNRLIDGVVGHWAGNCGHHRIDGVYLESHEGSETYTNNNAVLIDTPSGQTGPNRFNHVYNVDVSSNLPGPALLRLVDDSSSALTNNNTFTNNRRAMVASQIIVGPYVRDTKIDVLPGTSRLWQVAVVDSGTNTIINGVANITYRDSSIWPDTTPNSGQVDAGSITFDTATGRGIVQDKYNDPHLIAPRPGLDVVAPYGPQRIQAMPTPPAPKVSVIFTGSTTWSYYLVAVDKDGNRGIPSPAATVTNGPATLNSGSYNWITWNPVEGAVKYDLLRGSTGQSVATNIIGTHFMDTASSTSAYSPSATNPPGSLTVDGGIELGHASDTTVTRLSAGKIAVEGVEVLTATERDISKHESLTAGILTIPRWVTVSSSVSAGASGTLHLTYFDASDSMTISNVTIRGGGTAAGATPTLIRFGLYSVAANGDLTLIASTANDTSMFSTISANHTKAFTGSVAVSYGQRLAIGCLVVSAATLPTFAGTSGPGSAEMAIAPRISGAISSQTDLPSNITAASVGAIGSIMYARLS